MITAGWDGQDRAPGAPRHGEAPPPKPASASEPASASTAGGGEKPCGERGREWPRHAPGELAAPPARPAPGTPRTPTRS